MKVKLEWHESQEIADLLTKTDNPNKDYAVTENALSDKWSIDLDTFHEIADTLFNLMDFGISPITQTPFVGFSKGNQWLAKKEVNQQFIHALIEWATEGESIPENSKGFIRTITKSGKPEFDIIIRKTEKGESNSPKIINE